MQTQEVAGPSRSMMSEVNTATRAASSEVPPVSMVNNPLYHAIFQTSATDTPVKNATNNTVARNAQETNQFQLQNATFPQQVLPMQYQQGSAVVLSQLSGQEGVPRLTYIPQGTANVGVQGTVGVTINQGPVGTGNNQGAVGENARHAGQHAQATNDRRSILYQN
ncbi:OLC1v1018599C1 [Oldenlandia corymbosa var. corymbosa]|uniref:OLC1v1018599C1 n=1 Tax=Oldenlandia corymbosa var. corymbosa TaxID=529605 RepID=A0AAV1EC75_OLDCO|nr:OLC1v1018599C1 [Oldenlandia corymbosa var. corymbosa]